MNLQYLSDKSGNATAVQIQIPIEDWEAFKKRYKEFDEEDEANGLATPEWHMALVEEELKKIANGTAGLTDWELAKKGYKV